MIVILNHDGRCLLIRAKPIGRNGYYDGKVIYDEPLEDKPANPPAVKEQPVAEVAATETHRAEPAIDRARRHPVLIQNWGPGATALRDWMKVRNISSGLVSRIHQAYREDQRLGRSPELAFFVAAAGEALGFWNIVENKNRTRFTMVVPSKG